MDVAPRVAALLYELVHQRKDGITDDLCLAAKKIEVERYNIRFRSYLNGRFRWDDTAAGLGTRQGAISTST